MGRWARRLGTGLGVAAGMQGVLGAQAGSWARRRLGSGRAGGRALGMQTDARARARRRQAAGAGGTGVRALSSRGRAGQAVADARGRR